MTNKKRWVEFFEGDNRQLSMTRLLCFLSFFPSSLVLMKEPSEGMMGWYIGGYVVGYVGGKTTDIFMEKKNAISKPSKK